MRDDFAVLILTHGRADNVYTVKSLKQAGYTGKWYIVIDNEDDQKERYIKNFGKDRVIEFDKQAVYDRIDTFDNFNNHKAIVYARNASWDIAEKLGLNYFLEFDDDYTSIEYRYIQGEKLKVQKVKDADRLFERMLDFLDVSGASSVALAQGGDFLGGAQGTNARKGLLRKAMNSFFCRTDTRFEFSGTINEDVNTYTTLAHRGALFFSYVVPTIVQKATQSQGGGMTELYLDGGTYVKTFYTVIACPSAVKVSLMTAKHKRIHHKVIWDHCTPKIINERYKKNG